MKEFWIVGDVVYSDDNWDIAVEHSNRTNTPIIHAVEVSGEIIKLMRKPESEPQKEISQSSLVSIEL